MFIYDDFTGKIRKIKGFGKPTFTRSTTRKTPEQIDKLRTTQLKRAEKIKTPKIRQERIKFIKSPKFDKEVRSQRRDYSKEFQKKQVYDIAKDTGLGKKAQRIIEPYLGSLSNKKLRAIARSKDPNAAIVRGITRTKRYKDAAADRFIDKPPRKTTLGDVARIFDEFYYENKDLIVAYNAAGGKDNPLQSSQRSNGRRMKRRTGKIRKISKWIFFRWRIYTWGIKYV